MEGWKCPVCGRGVAPSEKTCEHGGLGAPIVPTFIPHGPQWPNQWRPREWPNDIPIATGDRPVVGPTYTSGGSIESVSAGMLWNIGQNAGSA